MRRHEALVERNLWKQRALAAERQMARLREQIRNLKIENQMLSYELIEPSMTEIMMEMPRDIAPLLPGLERAANGRSALALHRVNGADI